MSRKEPQDDSSQYTRPSLIFQVLIIVVVVGGVEREEKKALGCEKIKGSQQVVEFMNSGLGEVWRGTASRHTL